MTSTSAGGRGSPLLAALAAMLILVDGVLAAIGLLVLNAQRNGNLTAAEAATFILLGASAAAGAVVMLLAAIALARGRPGRGTARLASRLAWLRVVAVLLALAVIAIVLGIPAIIGSFETFGAVIAVVEASLALVVTGTAVRRTHHG